MDVLKISVGSPLLAGDGYIGFTAFLEITGLNQSELLIEVSNLRLPLFCTALGWHGTEVLDIDEVERDFDGAYIRNSYEYLGDPVFVSGKMRLYDTAVAVGSLLAGGDYEVPLLFREKSRTNAIFLNPTQKLGIDSLLLVKSDAERLRLQLSLGVTDEMLEAAKAKPVAADPLIPYYTSAPAGKYDSWPVSKLIEEFLAAKKADWKEDQQRKMANVCEIFVELMDDPKLSQIDRALIRKFMARLQELPADVYQSRRRHGTTTLAELITASDAAGDPKMKPQTVNSYIGKLSEMLNWGTREEFLTRNPATGIALRVPEKIGVRDQDERCKFSQEELHQIFSVDCFRDGKPKLPSNGRYSQYQPYYYWLPLLGLYTGGRLNELAQIYLDDLAQDDGDTWFLDFNFNADDKLEGRSDKSLKTVNAVRQVVLHSKLIELGLIKYVERLRAAGHKRLFPELRFDKVKGYGKAAGSWFNERFLGRQLAILRDGMRSFHSFRHTFSTAMYHFNEGIAEATVSQLMGHQRGETMSAIRYRKDKIATQQLVYIDRMDFDLPDIAPFDVDAGMLALKNALDRKERRRRRT